jgi:hypothetical protein
MNSEKLAELSDEELLKVARQNRPAPVIDAFFIGFLVGTIIYGIAANGWGLIMLLPLSLIYLFLKKPKQLAAIKNELKKRNLTIRI